LLCRWWYVLPDWPPTEEEAYVEELKKRKYRQVSIQEWEWVPELDNNGLAKVYMLKQFPGVFRNSAGDMVDCRPQDTCPCYANFIKKDMALLYGMLVQAYENQLKVLKDSKYDESKLEADLKTSLTRARNKLSEARELTFKKN